MPLVHFVLPDGRTQSVQATPGWSLMQVARDAGVPGIIAQCGGSALCSTCHVYVDAAWLNIVGPASELEMITLDLAPEEPTAASRLSCQLIIKPEYEGLKVTVPQSQA